MRIQMRRFTRLTNAFSKKAQNHAASVDLHLLHYNFARIHFVTGYGIFPWMAAAGALFVVLGFVLWRNVKAREKAMNLGSKTSHSN